MIRYIQCVEKTYFPCPRSRSVLSIPVHSIELVRDTRRALGSAAGIETYEVGGISRVLMVESYQYVLDCSRSIGTYDKTNTGQPIAWCLPVWLKLKLLHPNKTFVEGAFSVTLSPCLFPNCCIFWVLQIDIILVSGVLQ